MQQLLKEIQDNARKTTFNLAHYLGTKHKVYNVSLPTLRKMASAFRKNHIHISLDLLNELFSGTSLEEKLLASFLMGKYPKLLVALPAETIDGWLSHLTGWAEVDTFCDYVDEWLRFDQRNRIKLLKKWNSDAYLEKRRASLVVLCSTVRTDPTDSWKTFAFQCINTLKHERHVMITKAISWLLRNMTRYHKDDVRRYLNANLSTLPKIAIREVTRKLETGRK